MEKTITMDGIVPEDLEVIKAATLGIDEEREQSLKEVMKVWCQDDEDQYKEELNRRFGPKSLGHHEAVDRISLISCNWEDYILEHPSVSMHANVYRLGQIISYFMAEMYQEIASMPHEEEECQCHT